MLTIGAPLPPRHQHATAQLCHIVDEQVPRGVEAIFRTAVGLGGTPPTVRVADLVVVRASAATADTFRLAPEDVLLVVEVLCDGTRRIDQVLKFAEYKAAGIPQYWIVDPGEVVTLSAFALVNGSYQLTGEHTGMATLDVAGHPVTIDLPMLTRR